MRVRTEKMIFGGQALARPDGRTCLVWNALAGEDLTVRILTEKKHYLEGIAVDIHQASPERIAPRETHFMACSPWQIFSWEAENRWKAAVALETYQRLGQLKNLSLPPIVTAGELFGYRNKLEYHFSNVRGARGDTLLSFAVHERESHNLLPVERCELACADIHPAASALLEELRSERIPSSALDKLTVKSNACGQVLFELHAAPGAGRLSRNSSIPWHSAEKSLTTEVLGVPITSGPRSFFQVNLPVFEQALRDMAEFFSPQDHVLDFYAGVGAISLPLAAHFGSALLVESHSEAAQFARRNIQALGLAHCEVREGRAEKLAHCIEPRHVLILDPPRAGLDPSLTQALLNKKPGRILYLSCNAATQARDLARLGAAYALRCIKLYNFFPRTPHFEALAILDRKS